MNRMIVFILLVLGIAMIQTHELASAPMADLATYRQAGMTLRAGGDPYVAPFTVPIDDTRSISLSYLYPPCLAAVLSWIPDLSDQTLHTIWTIVSILALGGGVYFLLRAINEDHLRTWIPSVFFGVIATSPPVLEGLYFGQVHALVFFLLCVAAYGITMERAHVAGFALGTAICIKASPIILVVPLLRLRNLRALVCIGIAIVCGFVIGASTSRGVAAWHDFSVGVQSILGGDQWLGGTKNYAPLKLLFGELHINTPQQIRVFSLLIVIVTTIFLFVVPIRNVQDRIERLRYFAIAIALMIISSPVLWCHHLTWLTPVLAVALHCSKSWRFKGVIIVAIALYSTLFVNIYLDQSVVISSERLRAYVGPLQVLIPVAYLLLTLLVTQPTHHGKREATLQ